MDTPTAVQAPEATHSTADGPDRSDTTAVVGTGACCTVQRDALYRAIVSRPTAVHVAAVGHETADRARTLFGIFGVGSTYQWSPSQCSAKLSIASGGVDRIADRRAIRLRYARDTGELSVAGCDRQHLRCP